MSNKFEALFQPLDEIYSFRQAKEWLERGKFPVHLSGCIESQKCQLLHGLMRTEKWRVIIAVDEIRAREIMEDYRMFDRDVLYYPGKDVIFYSADIHGNALITERLKVAQALLEDRGGTIVTTIDAGMGLMLSLDTYKDAIFTLEEAGIHDIEKLSKGLVRLGYRRQSQVETPGDFSIRGGIVDVFPITEDCPYRIEFWGDEIDTIRSFDVESQRSIERVPLLTIFPASEFIMSEGEIQQGIINMEEAEKKTKTTLKRKKEFEGVNRLSDIMENIKEAYNSYGEKDGLEGYLSYFPVETATFFKCFPKEETVFVMDDPKRCLERGLVVETEFMDSMENRLAKGYILPGQMDMLLSVSEMMGHLMNQRLVYLSMLESLPKECVAKEHANFQLTPVGGYNKHFELLVEDMHHWMKNAYRVILVCSSRTRGKRLCKDLAEEYGLPAFYREEGDGVVEPGQIMVCYGYMQHGFSYSHIKFAIVTEGDIFGGKQKKKRKRQKKYDGVSIQSFNELSVGDYVVHENHGLGIYRGIEKMQVDNTTKDYIKIEYGDGGNLYVLASGLDVLQKFASQDAGRKPKLNKLGSSEWTKTKSRVRGAVEEIAQELVLLYAKRQQQKGFVFSDDTVWQNEFEELFPYEETRDQLQAIEDTKRDMESDKIMDRLICGDVGYGKTEIALRAAFKAVNDGKQVAILVPTTILAQQHYNTLLERIGDFPVRVEMLSRFRTTTQNKKTILALSKGQIDVVIGTHRLLSKDVKFKDLGLLIVDEEQRFGVSHKEKIKQMKGNVDVLTLSATPIPRTLHMSLSGIRDMSLLREPPVDRMPIQTFVMEHSPEIIREAINRELVRGGQVYYVYNRVQNIHEVAAEVMGLCPDANVAFAHGQMSERELENIMLSFINKEIDVLVATTIIETGLDISNVNTIIIDHADKMGLSQLYQLRGRVGRSNRTAYAFLMYQKGRILKEVAEKRLSAIREYTELGSGIKVAMRDLEIRGAGNLLGAAQSGHMEAVGYDLYCKMLNEAVRKLKGEQIQESFETVIDVQVDAYIPATYIRSEFQKLDMYKRIAGVENQEDYENMQEELEDRFGTIPVPAENLLKVALCKGRAGKAQIIQIKQKPEGIRFYLHQNANISSEKVLKMLESYKGAVKYVPGKKGDTEPYFLYPMKKADTSVAFSRVGAKRTTKKDETEKIFEIIDQMIQSIGGIYEKSQVE